MDEGKARSRGGRPSRAEAERRDERLLEVAVDLFIEHGFAATSIETIARTAGVAKRTLYIRYPDKAALFAAAVRRLVEDWRSSVATLDMPDADIAITLRALGHSLLAGATPRTVALIRILFAEGHRFPELSLKTHEDCLKCVWEEIARILRRAIERGRLRIEDPIFAAIQFHRLITGEPFDRLLVGHPHAFTPEDREVWVRQSVDMFLNGVS
ncbi:MAG: TetR/AcrR family transcriptional regulator [Rhodospirillaceae bacterium]